MAESCHLGIHVVIGWNDVNYKKKTVQWSSLSVCWGFIRCRAILVVSEITLSKMKDNEVDKVGVLDAKPSLIFRILKDIEVHARMYSGGVSIFQSLHYQ